MAINYTKQISAVVKTIFCSPDITDCFLVSFAPPPSFIFTVLDYVVVLNNYDYVVVERLLWVIKAHLWRMWKEN